MSDIEFAGGIFPKAPHPRAPDFVKGQIRIKIDDAISFLESKRDSGKNWIDLDVKESRGGKWYASVNTWQEDRSQNSSNWDETSSDTDDAPEDVYGDIPF